MPQIFISGHDGKMHDFVTLLHPNCIQLANISLSAGDMILATCLDVPSKPPELLKRIEWDLKLGIPDVQDKY